MLSGSLEPLLTDFGLSHQAIAGFSMSATATAAGSLRWKAPELIREPVQHPNEQSDVWAFGMTILVSYYRTTWFDLTYMFVGATNQGCSIPWKNRLPSHFNNHNESITIT